MKILSPAGNFDCVKMAVYNGADEVYLGINEFNARNNIDGFTIDSLNEAVDFCHIYGVKICLAINILFNDNELINALTIVQKAYNMGVDYFIVQDLALAYLINKNLKDAVLHASTQMAIHNLEGVKAILPYGFKRVVLARETPLDEIKRIKQNVDIEIEYFVHGALCVSFSGNCYLSSYLNNASGNRGKCKQLCRLPYSLHSKKEKVAEGYLLSAKDFDMSNRLLDLQKAGVDVLKIEGRARRPFYVATTTCQYRNLLNGQKIDKDKLALAFNRTFTQGYFNGNGDIISNYPAHIGVNVGKITKVVEKKTYKEVYFNSNRILSPKSTYKTFYNGVEQKVITAYDLKKLSGENYMFTTTQEVKNGHDINLILNDEIERKTLSIVKKMPYCISLSIKPNHPITAQFVVKDKTYLFCGEILQQAKNFPLTKTEILENFNKSDIFDIKVEFLDFDNVFLPKKHLNEFRRKVLDELYTAICLPYKRNVTCISEQVLKCQIEMAKNDNTTPFTDFKVVSNLGEINDFNNKNIIYSPSEYDEIEIENAKNLCEKFGKDFYLDLPNFAIKKDVEFLQNLVEKLRVKFICNNYYSLNFKGEKVIGAGLNVYNNLTAKLFNLPYLTAEKDGKNNLKFPYMTLRHCPFRNHLKSTCDKCPYNDNYYLQMQSGKKLKIKRKKLSTCTFYLTD